MVFIGCSDLKNEEAKKAMVLEPKVSYTSSIDNNSDWEDYKSWLKSDESRHFASKELGGLRFSALLEPPLYSYLKAEGINAKKNFDDSPYLNQIRIEFELTALQGNGELTKYDVSGQDDYNERVNYYSFKVQNDVFLVLDNDTVPCGMAVWEREFNSAPRIKHQLLFTKPEGKKSFNDIQMVFYDRIFDNGIVKLKF
jgi:hypothetical protein